MVVDVDGGEHTQRFYRARPTAVPVFSVAPVQHGSSSPSTTPKANDARNRVALRDTPSDRGDSGLTSKTWTSRERIKAATCVSLSRDGRFLAVGETGYAPRVLIFSLQDGSSSNQPLMSLSEHGYGVRAVAWSQDGKYLASLGTVNDGFLLIWKVDPRNGSARFLQQNRCTAQVNGMVWLGNTLVTFGTRHMKAWKVDDMQRPISPPKKIPVRDIGAADTQRTLPGRNVVLGSLLEASFTCAQNLDETHALFCSDGGDVCLLDDTSGQTKLTRVAELGYPITCCTQRGPVAVVGGKDGQLVTLGVDSILALSPDLARGESGLAGLTVVGVVQDQLVTIDPERSIDIWEADSLPTMSAQNLTRTRLAGQNDPILGIQPIASQEDDGPVFFTWSGAGKVLLWDLNGRLRKSFDVAVEDCSTGNDKEPLNQLCVVRADSHGRFFAAGDRVGMLRVVDHATGEPLLETKAHSSEIIHIAVHQDASKAIIATCGRDRTVQLYSQLPNGSFDLLQTLEFPARVTNLALSPDDKIITCSIDRNMQVHELVSKEDEPQSLAAIQRKSIPLKATPTSIALDTNCRSIFMSSVDRAIYQFDLESGRQTGYFKCTDEKGTENVVVESLVFGSPKSGDEPPFIVGLSNTDKSVRVYDANTGAFMDREWGHTESINGVALVDDGDAARKVVSVGCDGTIMIWDLNLRDPEARATSRSPPPTRDAASGANRPPLRRVLSKTSLAEYQRPSSSGGVGGGGGAVGQRSPPRTLRPRRSRQNLAPSSTITRTSTAPTPHFHHTSPSGSTVAEGTPSRRPSSSRSGTSPPPDSPPSSSLSSSRRLKRQPSLPVLGTTPSANPATARKKTSAVNLRSSYGTGTGTNTNTSTGAGAGAGTGAGAAPLSQAALAEQTCRQLRAYRKKLSSSTEALPAGAAAELDAELRLTMAALGEKRAGGNGQGQGQEQGQGKEPCESALDGLLDRYNERLVSMLDERLRLRLSEVQNGGGGGSEEGPAPLTLPVRMGRERPRTAGG